MVHNANCTREASGGRIFDVKASGHGYPAISSPRSTTHTCFGEIQALSIIREEFLGVDTLDAIEKHRRQRWTSYDQRRKKKWPAAP
jgi:hypothetical protein